MLVFPGAEASRSQQALYDPSSNTDIVPFDSSYGGPSVESDPVRDIPVSPIVTTHRELARPLTSSYMEMPAVPAAPVRLHRVTHSINRSGLASSSGVLNIPIPGEFLQEIKAQRLARLPSAPVGRVRSVSLFLGCCPACRLMGGLLLLLLLRQPGGGTGAVVPMAPLRAWVLNGTWDPNFVLASTDMITAENRAAVLLGALHPSEGTLVSPCDPCRWQLR